MIIRLHSMEHNPPNPAETLPTHATRFNAAVHLGMSFKSFNTEYI